MKHLENRKNENETLWKIENLQETLNYIHETIKRYRDYYNMHKDDQRFWRDQIEYLKARERSIKKEINSIKMIIE